MNHEARLGYLCYLTARNKITLDEMSELLGYITLYPHIIDLIHEELEHRLVFLSLLDL